MKFAATYQLSEHIHDVEAAETIELRKKHAYVGVGIEFYLYVCEGKQSVLFVTVENYTFEDHVRYVLSRERHGCMMSVIGSQISTNVGNMLLNLIDVGYVLSDRYDRATEIRQMLAMIVGVTDGYLTSEKLARFFVLARRLPLELQGIVACRWRDSNRSFMALNDATIKWLFAER
jgi:hypothetical protein